MTSEGVECDYSEVESHGGVDWDYNGVEWGYSWVEWSVIIAGWSGEGL